MDFSPEFTSPRAGGWTDAQKIELLVAIIKGNGDKPNWREVRLPAGRTQKSCIHMWARLKAIAAESENAAPAPTNQHELGTPQKKGPNNKRQKPKDDDNGGEDETPTKKPTKSNSTIVKKEPLEEEKPKMPWD